MKFIKLHEVYRNSGLGKWFHDESAGGKPGWDRYNSSGKRVGECGDAKKGASYSACLSKQKAAKLGKEGISSFVKRKRAAQSKAGRGKKGTGGKGKKPIFVKTGAGKMNECTDCQNQNVINFISEGLQFLFEGKNKPKQPKKWSACIAAAKQKFDVYPSAYANAWAAKCYKKKGGGWKKVVKEETEKPSEEKPKLTPKELETLKNDTKFIKLGSRKRLQECFSVSVQQLIEAKRVGTTGVPIVKKTEGDKTWFASHHKLDGRDYIVSSNPNETLIFPGTKTGKLRSWAEISRGNDPTWKDPNFNPSTHHRKVFNDLVNSMRLRKKRNTRSGL